MRVRFTECEAVIDNDELFDGVAELLEVALVVHDDDCVENSEGEIEMFDDVEAFEVLLTELEKEPVTVRVFDAEFDAVPERLPRDELCDRLVDEVEEHVADNVLVSEAVKDRDWVKELVQEWDAE